MLSITQKDIDRFWSRVDKSGDCWIWTGGKNKQGYGAFHMGGKQYNTHRIVAMLIYGDIPSHICACHHCDNPACVNPAHIFLGTKKDNTQDMVRKGRSLTLHSREMITEIRYKYEVLGVKQANLAREYNISTGRIADIVHYKIRKNG